MKTMLEEKELIAKLSDKWYNVLMKSNHFRNMPMDEQGELCMYVAKMEIQGRFACMLLKWKFKEEDNEFRYR